MSIVIQPGVEGQRSQLVLATVNDKGELLAPMSPAASKEELSLYADLFSFAKRVHAHRPWAQKELFLLIENAANVGLVAKDLPKALGLFRQAAQVYDRDLLSKNRIRYVMGTSLGVAALIVLAALTVVLASHLSVFSGLATPQTIVALFAFAGMGSTASVLTRLSTMELGDETSKGMLLLSGASKPLIAVVFASIVYLVIKHQLIAVSMGGGGAAKPSAEEAAIWVAAFLCGFSERFASDIITKFDSSVASAKVK